MNFSHSEVVGRWERSASAMISSELNHIVAAHVSSRCKSRSIKQDWSPGGREVSVWLNIDVFRGLAGVCLPWKTQLVSITNAARRKLMSVVQTDIEF